MNIRISVIVALILWCMPLAHAVSWGNGSSYRVAIGEPVYKSKSDQYLFSGVTNGGQTLVLTKRSLENVKKHDVVLYLTLFTTTNFSITLLPEWLGDPRTPGTRLVNQTDVYFPDGAVLTIGVDNYSRAYSAVQQSAK
jgi:hypothetical protein